MAKEVKGYQFDLCFGSSGCPHQIQPSDTLAERIEHLLQSADLLAFLKSKGITDLKFHHEFRVTMANCPNACSQPQIKDIGIISAALPAVSDEACSDCRACTISAGKRPSRSVKMPRCQPCTANVAWPAASAFRSVPRAPWWKPPRGIAFSWEASWVAVPNWDWNCPASTRKRPYSASWADCLDLYKKRSRRGERFGELVGSDDVRRLADRYTEV